jgi:molybdopterin-containing oxidoreductase family iron-sulfur binding subunit
VVACQAENNIPVVGKEQVANQREMHWLRVDTYFEGPADNPKVVHQPVTCVHCENAPCEQVCPVGATVHDHDGLNVMVYNRCIGTRYCSNNCPFKVRRFNFFHYHVDHTATEKMVHNPDVTVRSRGVMEKCTFCVQRIERVKIAAKNEGRPIEDGEIRTACQVACPTQAIVFGDLNDPEGEARLLHEDPRSYLMLEELHIKPRTAHLARVRNPNPELAKKPEDERDSHS